MPCAACYLTSGLGFALALSACEKSATSPTISDGTYAGTFQRQVGGGGLVSAVSLVLAGGKWSGRAQTPKYPALCNGTYRVSGSQIYFKNACFWTAEFDWSLILTQEYEWKQAGN